MTQSSDVSHTTCSVLFHLQVSDPEQAITELEEKLGLTLRGYVDGTTSVPKHLALPVANLGTFLRSRLGLQAQGMYIRVVFCTRCSG